MYIELRLILINLGMKTKLHLVFRCLHETKQNHEKTEPPQKTKQTVVELYVKRSKYKHLFSEIVYKTKQIVTRHRDGGSFLNFLC